MTKQALKGGSVILLVIGACIASIFGIAAISSETIISSHEVRIEKIEQDIKLLHKMDGKLDLLLSHLIKGN